MKKEGLKGGVAGADRGATGRGVDWRSPAPRWLAYGLTAAGLLAGYLIKHQCVVNAWANHFQYRRLCYSDIQALWALRGIRDGLLPYRDVSMEYPVLTGMIMDLSGRLLRLLAGVGLADAPSHSTFFVVSALLMAPFGFAVTALIRPFVPARRLAVWAVGTPIVLYGFMNWDLPAAAAGTWALTAFLRKRYGWAGVAAAVGASAKLYPAFFLPAMLLAAWARPQKKDLLRLLAGFGLAYAAINIPWIIVSNGVSQVPPGTAAEVSVRQPGTNGWLQVWLFHARRGAEFDTIWFWLAEQGEFFSGLRREPFVSYGTLGLFVALSAALLAGGWTSSSFSAWRESLRRRYSDAGFHVLRINFGILCAFLVSSKIYSPQYGLWLAPLLALVPVPWAQVAVFLVGDLTVFVSRFNFYIQDANVDSGWAAAFQAGVWVRAGALIAMIWWALRAANREPATSPD